MFWENPSRPGVAVTLVVSPEETDKFIEILNIFQIDYRSLSDNVQQLIDNSRRREDPDIRKRGNYEFRHYQDYEEVDL